VSAHGIFFLYRGCPNIYRGDPFLDPRSVYRDRAAWTAPRTCGRGCFFFWVEPQVSAHRIFFLYRGRPNIYRGHLFLSPTPTPSPVVRTHKWCVPIRQFCVWSRFWVGNTGTQGGPGLCPACVPGPQIGVWVGRLLWVIMDQCCKMYFFYYFFYFLHLCSLLVQMVILLIIACDALILFIYYYFYFKNQCIGKNSGNQLLFIFFYYYFFLYIFKKK
jgi:hypothetical protein